MEAVFYGSIFNGDISAWNLSQVTNMCAMFSQSEFKRDLSNWDVRGVQNIRAYRSYRGVSTKIEIRPIDSIRK